MELVDGVEWRLWGMGEAALVRVKWIPAGQTSFVLKNHDMLKPGKVIKLLDYK